MDQPKIKTKLFGANTLFAIETISYIKFDEFVTNIVKKFFPDKVSKSTSGAIIHDELSKDLQLLSNAINSLCLALESIEGMHENDMQTHVRNMENMLKRAGSGHKIKMNLEIFVYYIGKLDKDTSHELFWRCMRWIRDAEIARELATAFFRISLK